MQKIKHLSTTLDHSLRSGAVFRSASFAMESEEEEDEMLFNPTAQDLIFDAIRANSRAHVTRLPQEMKSRRRPVDLNRIEDIGNNGLLHVAAREGHLPIVELLVKEGLHLDAQNDAGKTPVHLAAWRGHEKVVSFLLRSGADLFVEDNRKRNPLMTTAIRGDAAMMAEMLDYVEGEQPLLVDARDVYGHTALWYAVTENHASVLRQLAHGDATMCDEDGSLSTLQRTAESEGHWECLVVLAVRTGVERPYPCHGLSVLLANDLPVFFVMQDFVEAIEKVKQAVRAGDAERSG